MHQHTTLVNSSSRIRKGNVALNLKIHSYVPVSLPYWFTMMYNELLIFSIIIFMKYLSKIGIRVQYRLTTKSIESFVLPGSPLNIFCRRYGTISFTIGCMFFRRFLYCVNDNSIRSFISLCTCNSSIFWRQDISF